MPSKTIVITGASRGLGAGIAETLLAKGMRLGLCARTSSVFAGQDKVVFSSLDVRDEDAMFAFAQSVENEFGGIDLWINNAGILEPIDFVRELKSQDFLDHLAVNVAGVLHGSKAYLKHRKKYDGGGVLINISSKAALQGYAAWAAYCAGKAAVDRLTECIQLEEASTGLRAYSIAPGVIDTDMQSTIRSLSKEQFPTVEKFITIKKNEAFNSPSFVAMRIFEIAFGDAPKPENVVLRLDDEKA